MNALPRETTISACVRAQRDARISSRVLIQLYIIVAMLGQKLFYVSI